MDTQDLRPLRDVLADLRSSVGRLADRIEVLERSHDVLEKPQPEPASVQQKAEEAETLPQVGDIFVSPSGTPWRVVSIKPDWPDPYLCIRLLHLL